MMPLNRPSPKTPPWNQKLRLYLAYNRSYDSLKFFKFSHRRHCIISTFETLNLKFDRAIINSLTSKRHYLAQIHVKWRVERENRSNERVCRPSEELRKKCSKHSKNLGVFFGYRGAKPPGRIEANFLEDVRDVITRFKFGDDRFRGLASAEAQILPFLDGRPYNTLTLPWYMCDMQNMWNEYSSVNLANLVNISAIIPEI